MFSNEMIKKRDSLMFVIITDFCKQNTDRKIMVWSANFHVAHDLNQVTYSSDTSFYNFMIPLGQHLKQEYGDKVYNIAFTHPNHIKYSNLNDTVKNTMEYYLYNQFTADISFVDFEKIRKNEFYVNKIFPSYLLYGGRDIHFGKWFHLFDGVFFIRNHQASTIQGKTWQELQEY